MIKNYTSNSSVRTLHTYVNIIANHISGSDLYEARKDLNDSPLCTFYYCKDKDGYPLTTRGNLKSNYILYKPDCTVCVITRKIGG